MMGISSKNILYIGNNLTSKTKYATTIDTLSSLLNLEGYTVLKTSSKLNKLARLADMCLTLIKSRRKIEYVFIDTFSTSNFYFALLTSQLARIFKIRYIPILHGGNLPFRLDKSNFLSKLIFINSYVNVAPSNYLKNEFEKRGFNTIFIPNTLEIEKYKYQDRENMLPKILWVRAFKHLYNPLMAIKVLAKVKEEFEEAELCMIGPVLDVSFNETKALANKLNLNNSIQFTGVLSKEEWHKKAKEYALFINTTNVDNTPVSVMEAMALGLTIVSTNAGGMPYLIEDNYDGVLVDKNDHIMMANSIIKILKENNRELSKKARIKAESFGWDVVKNQWKSLLNN
jgi:glycosyltransferase involved in cell wall biosynthesis